MYFDKTHLGIRTAQDVQVWIHHQVALALCDAVENGSHGIGGGVLHRSVQIGVELGLGGLQDRVVQQLQPGRPTENFV